MSSKFESGARIDVNEHTDEQTGKTFVRIRSAVTGTACQATAEEWHAFLDDLGEGRWAHIAAQAVTS